MICEKLFLNGFHELIRKLKILCIDYLDDYSRVNEIKLCIKFHDFPAKLSSRTAVR